MTGAAELRRAADEARTQRTELSRSHDVVPLRAGETLLATLWQASGEKLTVTWQDRPRRVHLRLWTEDGYPIKGVGVNIAARLLPEFADAIAVALDRYRVHLSEQQTQESRDRTPMGRVYTPEHL